MNKNIVYALFVIFTVVFLTVCKKSSDTHTPFDGKFSFIYNGTQFVLPYKEGTVEWSIINGGIYINRPDLFNGVIYFPSAHCAYLEPSGSYISKSPSDCSLTQNGLPIDSATVYLYQSGSMSISYTNCYHKSDYDIVTGTTIEYDVCDAKGTFDLVLVNNEGRTITIKSGTFQMYSFKR